MTEMINEKKKGKQHKGFPASFPPKIPVNFNDCLASKVPTPGDSAGTACVQTGYNICIEQQKFIKFRKNRIHS